MMSPGKHCESDSKRDVSIGEIEEVERFKDRLELPREIAGVLRAHPKGNEGTGVPENRMANVVVELMKVLVGEGEPSAVFS